MHIYRFYHINIGYIVCHREHSMLNLVPVIKKRVPNSDGMLPPTILTCAVPKTSLTVPVRFFANDLVLICLAMSITFSIVKFPLCLTEKIVV